MEDYTIRQLVNETTQGTIRIPAFQRGFVWDPERVAFLMDSMYKSYPFGALIFWSTKAQMSRERDLGPFVLPEPKDESPIHYVLDGQQRLTSIFSVFQTDLPKEPDAGWTNIYFDFEAEAGTQHSQFIALEEDQTDATKHFPISTFFDSVAYRKATEALSQDQIQTIDMVQSVFKETKVPVQVVKTDDPAKIAIVFERVNRLGVDLDLYQLMTAWTWSDDFDLQDKFQDLADSLDDFGFGGVSEDKNLLLRCCGAVLQLDPSPTALINLDGKEVRDRFAEVENGIRGAIDFLRKEFGVETLGNLPYPALIVPLAVYFAHQDGSSVKLTDSDRRVLTRWFWRACFSRRFSAAVLRNLVRDVEEASKLRKAEPSVLDEFSAAIDSSYFSEKVFSVGAVQTKTYILLLVSMKPLSFVSGAKVDLANVLQKFNRNEFHHLMPKAFLKSKGFETSAINRLGNFAIISAGDNKTLGGTAPSAYKAKMPDKSLKKILAGATCPTSLFEDEYTPFLEERSTLLAEAAQNLMK